MNHQKQVLIAVLASALCLGAAARSARISFGPDSLVDSTPTAAYVEPALAVSPTDSSKLIAGSMLFGNSGITMEAFHSDDGGSSWLSTALPTASGSLLGDVQAAFDATGRAYMAGLGASKSAGRVRNGLYFFASPDAGQTFARTAFLQYNGSSYDHEQLAIDRTHSRYRGRIYMSVLYVIRAKPQINGLGILWSSNGGRTFHGPVQAAGGWSFNSRPVVLADGTVLFGLINSPTFTDPHETVQMTISRDGGQSFSKPYKVGTRIVYNRAQMAQKRAQRDLTYDGDSVPQFAAGGGQTAYGIWSDIRTGRSRLLFTRSTDGGRHWATSRVVLTSADRTDAQYQPSIAVNHDGVIGISWYNASFSRNSVSEMFAVSNDGGKTFSLPTVISSSPALLRVPGQDSYTAVSFTDTYGLYIGFVTPNDRYPSGGDYMEIGVDSAGAFHPVWIDARTGVNQIWTTTVFAGAPPADPPSLTEQTVTKQVSLDFGTAKWDGASHTITVPVRLRNTSKLTLYPPFTVVITRTTNPYDLRTNTEVAVLNSDNGKAEVGAQYTYTAKTLGSLGRLLPGGTTSARMWKMRISADAMNPMLFADVRAYTAGKSQ